MLPPDSSDQRHHHDTLEDDPDLDDPYFDDPNLSDPNNLMRGPGRQFICTEFLDNEPLPTIHRRSCVLDPNNNNGQAYFFAGKQYIVINLNVASGTINDTIASGPKPILGNWVDSNFDYVDTILVNPFNKEEAYVFCGEQYILINTIRACSTNDFIINGAKKFVDDWPSLRQLRNAGGFRTIDAFLPLPKDNTEVYIFSEEKYALVKIMPGTTLNHYIIDGPKIIEDEWPSLRQIGFDKVDMILPNPTNSDEAYFFYAALCVLIRIKTGTHDDHIVSGPKALGETLWPSVEQARFFY